MRNMILLDEFHETDFKPSRIYLEYLNLTQQDVQRFLIEGKTLNKTDCPACGSSDHEYAFTRFNLNYEKCISCKTLFVSHRPDDSAIIDYYENSAAEIFWRSKLAKETNQKRLNKIIKPRIQWIVDSTREYLPDANRFADCHGNNVGYINEVIASRCFSNLALIHPFFSLAERDLSSQVEVFEESIFELDRENFADVVTLFEVTDHTVDIESLFFSLKRTLRKGGLCFITAILSSGFDIQILGEHAEQIFPPDRLNVFSVEGFKSIFKRHGFNCLEFSTPGVLDLEIVEKTLKSNPEVKIPTFITYLLKERSKEDHVAFQQFLQKSLLSSSARILIQKI